MKNRGERKNRTKDKFSSFIIFLRERRQLSPEAILRPGLNI